MFGFHSLAYIIMNMLLKCLFCRKKNCLLFTILSLPPHCSLAGSFWNRSLFCRGDYEVTLWVTEDSESSMGIKKGYVVDEAVCVCVWVGGDRQWWGWRWGLQKERVKRWGGDCRERAFRKAEIFQRNCAMYNTPFFVSHITLFTNPYYSSMFLEMDLYEGSFCLFGVCMLKLTSIEEKREHTRFKVCVPFRPTLSAMHWIATCLPPMPTTGNESSTWPTLNSKTCSFSTFSISVNDSTVHPLVRAVNLKGQHLLCCSPLQSSHHVLPP